MENKFYIDDFERYLKEKADEFKMYPSKRVWNSIYNDMHPGSRWPSISTCIVLIGTLFLVGFLNTTTTVNKNNSGTVIVDQIKAAPLASANSTNTDKPIIIAQNNAAPSSNNKLSTLNNRSLLTTVNRAINNDKSVAIIDQSVVALKPNTEVLGSRKFLNIKAAIVGNIIDKSNNITGETIANEDATNLLALNLSAINFQSGIEKNSQYETITEQGQGDQQIKITASDIAAVPASNQPLKSSGINNQLSEADKFWIENYALYNRPAAKKWKGRLSRQFYFTPSVVYRSLENTANKSISAPGFVNNSDVDNAVSQTPSFGIELGTGLQYDLFKKLKIKAGIQLNFTRYNSHAFDNGHPIATSLTMLSSTGNSAYEVYRISPYNSAYGITPVKLHNQTYQVSLPIGADYKLGSVDNIEWYAGATIQPTFVLAGRSYLISTDRRNYVKESDMLNRFNLNAGFETYLSIKTKGLTWQIGPQFRKQLFSTNDKTYSIDEKLLSYGLKIGIVKKL